MSVRLSKSGIGVVVLCAFGVIVSGPAGAQASKSAFCSDMTHIARADATAIEHPTEQDTHRLASDVSTASAALPPATVGANRAQLVTLVASNLLGHNVPPIAAAEAQYRGDVGAGRRSNVRLRGELVAFECVHEPDSRRQVRGARLPGQREGLRGTRYIGPPAPHGGFLALPSSTAGSDPRATPTGERGRCSKISWADQVVLLAHCLWRSARVCRLWGRSPQGLSGMGNQTAA